MKLITTPRPTNDQVAGREAMHRGLPWIVPESLDALRLEIDIIRTPHNPQLRVFEWGSGGSTLYWLINNCYVTTLERRARWYLWVQDQSRARRLKGKLEIYLIPLSGAADSDYANAIRAYDDSHFDLVFVDGEAAHRNQALKAAAPKIKEDGILLLDNSNWYDTSWLQEDWDEIRWQTEEYEWMGKPMVWATSILKRKVQ